MVCAKRQECTVPVRVVERRKRRKRTQTTVLLLDQKGTGPVYIWGKKDTVTGKKESNNDLTILWVLVLD